MEQKKPLQFNLYRNRKNNAFCLERQSTFRDTRISCYETIKLEEINNLQGHPLCEEYKSLDEALQKIISIYKDYPQEVEIYSDPALSNIKTSNARAFFKINSNLNLEENMINHEIEGSIIGQLNTLEYWELNRLGNELDYYITKRKSQKCLFR